MPVVTVATTVPAPRIVTFGVPAWATIADQSDNLNLRAIASTRLPTRAGPGLNGPSALCIRLCRWQT